MRALLAAIILSLAGPVFAQEDRYEVKQFGQCGLVTRYASTQLKDQCLQQAQNVYLDEDAGITRRKGFAKYNSTALTDLKSVRGLWRFQDDDGTDYLVALSSKTMYKSSANGTFSGITGLVNLSDTQDMDCAQCLGKLWCVNGADTMFYWDGTSTSTVAGAPTCQAIDCFRNRVALFNCTGSLSQLRLSGELDGTDYTIPSTPVSTSPVALSIGGVNDGKRGRCIMGTHQDVLVLGKDDSTWGLYGFDRRDFVVREISREVGCTENRSGREKQGSLFWMSQRGIERMTGPKIERVSDPIRDTVDTIIAAAGNTRSITDSSQADFQAGNLTFSGAGAPVSATISPGNVTVSSFTATDSNPFSSAASFVSISTGDTLGIVTLSSDTFKESCQGRTSGTVDTNVWSGATPATCDSSSRLNLQGSMYATSYVSTGSWRFSTYSLIANTIIGVYFIEHDVVNHQGYELEIRTNASGQFISAVLYRQPDQTSLISIGNFSNPNAGIATEWEITRTQSGRFEVFVNGSSQGSATDTTYSSSTYVMITNNGTGPLMDDINFYGYKNFGKIVSKTFDTTFSTPTWGTFQSTFSSNGSETNVFFYTQSSSDGNTWDSVVAASDTLRAASAQKRYVRYEADLYTTVSTKTPTFTSMSLAAATTGYFVSQCLNPGTSVTSWGIFACNQTTNNGSLTLEISTGSTCHSVTRSTAPWTTQSNNSVISVSTSAFLAYRRLFTVDSGTQTPTHHDCTVNWNEGNSRPSVSAEVYRDRYYLAYTSATTGTPVNNDILVLDSRDQWVQHDAPNCASLGLFARKLYCGDSGSTGQVYQMDVGQDDNGSSFTSTIRTKDFDFGNPFQKKQLSRVYYDLGGLPTQDYTINLTPSYSLDTSTDTITLEDIGLGEDYGRFIASKVPADLSQNVTGRWFSFGLSHSGTQGPWKLFGLKFIFDRLKED